MVAVSFDGLMSLVDDPDLQIDATITVGDRDLAIETDHQELGSWKLGDCKAERHGDDEVMLTVGGDRIIFRPPSPEGFLEVIAESRPSVRHAERVAAVPETAESLVAVGRHRQSGNGRRGRHRRPRFWSLE